MSAAIDAALVEAIIEPLLRVPPADPARALTELSASSLMIVHVPVEISEHVGEPVDACSGVRLPRRGPRQAPARVRVRSVARTQRREVAVGPKPPADVCVTELRYLLAGAERDLADFVARASDWAPGHLPDYSAPVTAALARVLDLPIPAVLPES